MVNRTPVQCEGANEAAPVGFSSTAYWEVLQKEETPVPDPLRNDHLQAPTDTTEGGESKVPYYNFKEKFDRPPFISSYKKPCLSPFKKRRVDGVSGKKIERTKRCSN